ncbi:MAG: helix-turn-helix domain-containing protein [Corynebacterium sp.]|uniref:helix-turn-helix domain-containing protein n=1 Tax=Corynebacterium sp. TaxID=1720 RepID=UPI0026DED426|nr:helix-turn-helix domain-containing protein [Corynebacterium sp.]MDO5669201.1 helix-turn-helix domain-containing protein [Corynebacterium sp.]
MTGTSAPRKKTGKPAGNDPVLLELGAQLAQRRRDIGGLQADIAEKAGVSRSTLHTIEHGGTGVRWEKVAAVAHALGMTMNFEVAGEQAQ